MGYWLHGQQIILQSLGGTRDFSLLHTIHIDYGAHLAYSVGTRGSVTGVKAAGT
jgi:hypothetical protein